MGRFRFVGLLLAVCALGAAGLAVAGQRDKEPPPPVPLSAGAGPVGYTLADSGPISLPDDSQTSGTAMCPSGTVVWGGGSIITSSDLRANLNSSYPLTTERGWKAYATNRSGAPTTFRVRAVCAKQPLGYKIVKKTFSMPAFWQSGGVANCPSGSEALSGGGLSSSRDLLIWLNSTFPTINSGGPAGWATQFNNAGSVATAKLTVYAVCAKPPNGFSIGVSDKVNSADHEDHDSFNCTNPSPVAIGAGVYSSSKNERVNINGLAPRADGVDSYENNNGSDDERIATYGICVS